MKSFFLLFTSLVLCVAALVGLSLADVLCPDHQARCPSGTTCCALSGGQYGCCPMPNAICCADHLHCCPHGTQCDVQHQQCLENPSAVDGTRRSHPMQRKIAAKSGPKMAAENVGDNNDVVTCPDGQHVCPAHTTCCPLDARRGGRHFWRAQRGGQSTSYGCCPAEKAVCCADHVHCCPHGTQCDVQEGKCLQANGQHVQPIGHTPMIRHSAAPQHERTIVDDNNAEGNADANNDDDDNVSLSSSGESQEGKLGNDNARDKVRNAEWTLPSAVLCGGGGATKLSLCPRDGKCCRHRDPLDGSKADGCCPLADGQCCAHSPHCCPAGFACDSEEGQCISEQSNGVTLRTSASKTTKATRRTGLKFFVEDLERIDAKGAPKMCPDGTVCHSSTATCCARTEEKEDGQGRTTTITQYNCCSSEKATCCSDSRCCPSGYKCVVRGMLFSDPPRTNYACERMSAREMIAQLFYASAGAVKDN